MKIKGNKSEPAAVRSRLRPIVAVTDGVLVHQGIPQPGLDLRKASHDDREERMRHLQGALKPR